MNDERPGHRQHEIGQEPSPCVLVYPRFPSDVKPGPCGRCGPHTPQGQISGLIDEHGLATVAVNAPTDDAPADMSSGGGYLRYVQTVGRGDRGEPELVIIGFESHVAASVLLREIVRYCDVQPGMTTSYAWPNGSLVTVRFRPLPQATAEHLMRDAAHRYGAGGFTGLLVEFLGMECLDPECRHKDCPPS